MAKNSYNLTGLKKFAQQTYTVVKNDTLSEIAQRYGLKTNELAAAKNISDVNKIRVGQKLSIPAKPNLPTEGPLGYRQNNPGNIRSDGKTKWEGASWIPAANTFLTFNDPYDGFRAMARILYNYKKRHKLDTLESIISRYSPSSENDTQKYISVVRDALGLQPGEQVDTTDEDFLQRLVPAMTSHEIGDKWLDKYDRSSISNAVTRAMK